MRDNGSCPDGAKCEYSHDKAIIDAAKKKKKEKEDKKKAGKGGGQNKGSKGDGKNDKKGSGNGNKSKMICRDFNNPSKGCLRGSTCHFLHEQPAMAAARPTTAPATAGASS